MEAIVLCGGFGTRLRDVVSNVPKPMAPIGNEPFLAVLLRNLNRKGFSRAVLSVGYLADSIVDYFGDSYLGIDLEYVREDSPLGTGGATKLALAKAESDNIFVLNGDTFLDFEAQEIYSQRLLNRQTLIVARQVPDTSRYGSIILREGKIVSFGEKEGSGPGIINSGCYVFSKNELSEFKPCENFSLESDYLALRENYCQFDIFTTNSLFIDIGVPEDYSRAAELLASW